MADRRGLIAHGADHRHQPASERSGKWSNTEPYSPDRLYFSAHRIIHGPHLSHTELGGPQWPAATKACAGHRFDDYLLGPWRYDRCNNCRFCVQLLRGHTGYLFAIGTDFYTRFAGILPGKTFEVNAKVESCRRIARQEPAKKRSLHAVNESILSKFLTKLGGAR